MSNVENEIKSIIGYTAETSAPNSQPTVEYITDRWMKPRVEALTNLIKEKMAEAWEQGKQAEKRDWELLWDLSTPDEDRQPWTNPYK